MNIKLGLARAKKDYHERLQSLKYWNKIDKMFKRMRKKEKDIFSYTFTHLPNIFSKFQPDDEWKINTYAEKNGYEIVDEKLKSTQSTYIFKLKE